ncbi:hypothetical protein OQA88_7668 [Cercophora sp. LCS_1]
MANAYERLEPRASHSPGQSTDKARDAKKTPREIGSVQMRAMSKGQAKGPDLDHNLKRLRHVQPSNAISFLRTLRKAAARAQQWNSDLEDMFPGICGPYDQPNEGMSPLIQRMHDKIFKSLCQRIQTVDRLNDRPSRLEATALRSLLLTLVGQLTGKSPHELEPFDESLASMVLRDTSFETDLGLALTLRSRMIAGSTRFNSRLMTEYTTLLMNFQHVLQPLVTNIDCRDLIPPDPYHCALFDEWARGVPATADAFWNIQDYLGSTVAQVYLQDFHSMCGEGEDSVANPARDVVHVLRFSPASYKDVADRHGRTLLHIAAQYNFSDVIKVMLGLSLDVDVRTKRNSTALHYAASLGHLEVCNVLLQESANANARDCMGRTPLHYAAVADRHNVVARFLGLPEINCSVQDGHGRTPFMWAITGKGRTSENCCQLFSTRLQNADLQIADNEGQTVLHFAANMRPGSQKQLEMLETVASKCPGLINRQSHSGDTVLTVVSARPEPENLRTVQCLLSIEGIDAGLRNKEGMTALHCAAKNGHLEVCRLLGLRVDGGLLAKCNAGFTPCKYAESNNHASVALLLQRFEDRALAYASDQHLRG